MQPEGELFNLAEIETRPCDLPGEMLAALNALRADVETVALAGALYSLCSGSEKSNWPRCWKFLRDILTAEGVNIVCRLADSAQLAIQRKKPLPLGSDRFCRWSAFEYDFRVTNETLPLYLAAVARAFPGLAPSLSIETAEAKIIAGHDWKPLTPNLQN